ncbi:MAG: hypothetical protein JKY37_14960 [Nannocystaceae bacterium]|nr:hypothetical protein [Nannocystaceae bacterium]
MAEREHEQTKRGEPERGDQDGLRGPGGRKHQERGPDSCDGCNDAEQHQDQGSLACYRAAHEMRLPCALLAATIAGTAIFGCSGRKDPAPWIDNNAAVVHCTTAGRTRMPPVLLGLPFPPAPTGLYARGMDPMALTDMGYERDQVACAAMFAPNDAAIRRAREELPALSSLIQRTSEAVVRTVSCPCETAGALGVRQLVVACASIPARKCSASQERQAELSELLSPLVQAIETTRVPRRHWRLVGATDRPTWFADRLADLLGRHVGGSVVYRPGQAVPARDNYVLLRALLKQPNVVAVVRQDGGRAFMVARVVDGIQVLDHFELPAVATRFASVSAYLDNARVSDVIEALDKPATGYRAGVAASAGNFIELDAANLERIDAMTVAASALSGQRYDEAEETREAPPVFVERVAVQAPFGADGRALRVRISLSDSGALWATGLPNEQLGADLDVLNLSGARPSFVSALEESPDVSPAFVLRGTATNRVLVHGLHAMGDVLRALETYQPGAINGETRAWEFEIPQGSLAIGMSVPLSLRALTEQVTRQDYRAVVNIDDDKRTVVADIVPR